MDDSLPKGQPVSQPAGTYGLGQDPAIGSVSCFWRHGDKVHGDWIRVLDMEGMPAGEIAGHTFKSLVEYEGRKLRALMDGPDPIPPEDPSDDAMGTWEQDARAYDIKLKERMDWISTHAIFVAAPPAVDPMHLFRAFGEILRALPDDSAT